MEKEVELKIAEDFFRYVCSRQRLSTSCVLEVGCGYGKAAVFMAQIAQSLLLIDVDDKAVRCLSEQMAGKENVQVRCVCSGQVSGSFDVVYFFLSLHHIADVETELRNARQLLADNGLLFICEYIPDSHFPMHRFDQVPHEGFSIDQLQSVLMSCGFAVDSAEPLSTLSLYIGEKIVDYPIYVIVAH